MLSLPPGSEFVKGDNMSMLLIRQAQWDAMRTKREDACILRLENCLLESFPREVSALGPKTLRIIVRFGMERCSSHGHQTERETYLYLTLMFMLGSYFDEDPQLEWASNRLRHGKPGDPKRIDELHDEALRYLDQVAGLDNEHLVRALLRARAVDFAGLRAVPSAAYEQQITDLLQSIYPTKFSSQGEWSTRGVAKLGIELSEKYLMQGNEGAALLAVIAFLLGSGFDRDPQHPWVQEVLCMRGAAERKVKELHRRALEFANQGLS